MPRRFRSRGSSAVIASCSRYEPHRRSTYNDGDPVTAPSRTACRGDGDRVEPRHVIGEHCEMSTELFAAVVTRSRKGIEAALDRGAHLDAKEKEYGDTALLASKGNPSAKLVVDELARRGVTINPTPQGGGTAPK